MVRHDLTGVLIGLAVPLGGCGGAEPPRPSPGADEAALRALVDEFAILADRKDVDAQLLLFTEDAVLNTLQAGEQTGTLRGREEIGAAFGGFLSQFDTVYHMNGQHTASVDGDEAEGTLYSTVTLIGAEDGVPFRTRFGIVYRDAYVRESGAWRIATRTSDFVWTERDAITE